MSKTTPVKYKNVQYDSIKDCAIAHNVSVKLTQRRFGNGWNIKECIEGKEKKYKYKGGKYTLKELSNKFGIKQDTIRARINNGWSLDKAIKTVTGTGSGKTFEYKDKAYKTKRELCKAYNVDIACFSARLKQGDTLEQALESGSKTHHPIKFRKKLYKSKKALAEAFNISYGAFLARLTNDWTMEEALEVVKRDLGYLDACEGYIYKITCTITNKAYIGLTTTTLKKRLRQHIYVAETGSKSKLSEAINKYGPDKFKIKPITISSSREELARLELHYINRYKTVSKGYNTHRGGSLGGGKLNVAGREIKVEGKTYLSISAACRNYKVGRSTFEMRYKNQGWSLEEALGIKQRGL